MARRHIGYDPERLYAYQEQLEEECKTQKIIDKFLAKQEKIEQYIRDHASDMEEEYARNHEHDEECYESLKHKEDEENSNYYENNRKRVRVKISMLDSYCSTYLDVYVDKTLSKKKIEKYVEQNLFISVSDES